MVKGCSNNCMKITLIIVNWFSLFSSIGMIGSAIHLMFQSSMVTPLGGPVLGSAIGNLIFGILIFCISCMGCWGALQEDKRLLLNYSVFVGCEAALQIVAAIVLLIYVENEKASVQPRLHDIMILYPTLDETNDTKMRIDTIQTKLLCCGWDKGPEDWKQVNYTTDLPTSCCASNSNGTCKMDSHSFQRACSKSIEALYHHTHLSVVGTTFCAAFFKIIITCFACSLARAIDSRDIDNTDDLF